MNELDIQRIMVVDDSPTILASVKLLLERDDYEVITADSGETALDLINKLGLPHLLLVDLNMPGGMDGFELCKQVHKFSDVPIILLTAVEDEATIVKGLRHYADDYIIKPFRAGELRIRVWRVLQRVGSFTYTLSPVVEVDDRLQLKLSEREAIIENESHSLTPTEARLLYILMRHRGHTVKTEFLLRRLWPLDEAYEDRLHAHIYRLRKKIEVDPKQPEYIVADWGKGYLLPEVV